MGGGGGLGVDHLLPEPEHFDIPVFQFQDRTCMSYMYDDNGNVISGLSNEPLHQKKIGICKKKGADQLCSFCTADRRLCFRYTDRSNPALL